MRYREGGRDTEKGGEIQRRGQRYREVGRDTEKGGEIQRSGGRYREGGEIQRRGQRYREGGRDTEKIGNNTETERWGHRVSESVKGNKTHRLTEKDRESERV